MAKNEYKMSERVGIGVILLLLAYISFTLIQPFIVSLILAGITAYLSYPIFKWTNKSIGHRPTSAIIMSFLLLIILLIPSVFILNNISKETLVLYKASQENLGSISETIEACKVCQQFKPYLELVSPEKLEEAVTSLAEKLVNLTIQLASQIAFSIPTLLLNIFVFLFVLYYSYTDGEHFLLKLKDTLPLLEKHREKIFSMMSGMTHAILYGMLLSALIEGAISYVGFLITGIKAPLLLATLVSFFVFIPMLGASIVWGPVAAYQLYTGQFWQAAIIITLGLIIAYVDSIAKAKIISVRSQVHPLLIFFGLLGGLALFGFSGIILGPLILAFFDVALKIYLEISD